MSGDAGVLALDIGGANLKAAHSKGTIACVPFALWKQPSDLTDALRSLLESLPPADRLAVTMTGELCDCFTTKAEGVGAILDAVARVADRRDVHVFQTDACFVSVDAARQAPLKTAAANWMALATYAARCCPDGPGLLIDIGSTTTDIIPLRGGTPCPQGSTDTERLGRGELVYTGVRRTPVCALLREAPWRDGRCRVAAELFATTLDVYLQTGDLPDADEDLGTADGRPATQVCARGRLARMVCADETTVTQGNLDALARAAADAQRDLITAATQQVLTAGSMRPKTIVISGSGEFLARRVIERWIQANEADPASCGRPEIIAISERHGREASQAACAFALAQLATEVT